MNNNPNKLVPLKTAILNLVEDTDTESYLMMLPTLIRWGLEADQKVGAYYQYKKQIRVLTVQDCKIEIPCQAVMVLGMMFGNHGCECGLIFDQMFLEIYTYTDAFDSNLVFSFSDNELRSDQVDWEIQGNNIVFPYGYSDGQEMTIMFLEYEVDEKGMPMVHYYNIEAITAYLKWKLVAQKTHKTFLKNGNFYADRAYTSDCKREWNNACANARVNLMDPTNSQLNEIGEILNNPMSGKGNILLQKNY